MSPATAESISVVNMAARQRMLSQRMILQTMLAAAGNSDKLQAAQTSFQLFCDSQKVLASTTRFDAASARLIRDTYEGPRGVGRVIDQFMRQMRLTLQYIAEGTAGLTQRALSELVASTDSVLDALNTATMTFDRITRGRSEQLMKELTGIVSDIQTVAREAKMVSFNAQIMAARAGEHGREFSVVANVLSGITGEIDQLSHKAVDLAVRSTQTA